MIRKLSANGWTAIVAGLVVVLGTAMAEAGPPARKASRKGRAGSVRYAGQGRGQAPSQQGKAPAQRSKDHPGQGATRTERVHSAQVRAYPSRHGTVRSGSVHVAGRGPHYRHGVDGAVVRGPYGGAAGAVRGPHGGGAAAVRGPHGGGAVAVRGPYGGGAVAVRRPYYHRGATFGYLPTGHRSVVLHGSNYYVHDDVYYVRRPYHDGFHYVVVRPPVSATVVYLPTDYRTFVFGGTTYYYYDDVYYVRQIDGDRVFYAVVEVPIDGVIYDLPERYETVVVTSRSYYRVNTLYYRPCYHEGRVAYMRVRAPF